jgi:flagellar protein FliL
LQSGRIGSSGRCVWEKFSLPLNTCSAEGFLLYTWCAKSLSLVWKISAMAEHEKEEVNASLEGEEGESKKSKLPLIIIGVVLLLLIGGGAGAYFMGLLDPLLGKKPAETCTTDEHGKEVCTPAEGEHAAAEGGHGAGEGELVCAKDSHGKEVCAAPGAQFLKIPNMTVNLNSEDGTPRFLRLAVQLEFKNAEDMAAVEKLMPRVIDQFQTYLRELRVKDLRGSAGIYRLQMELLSRVNQAAYPVEVQGVLFQEILIQ